MKLLKTISLLIIISGYALAQNSKVNWSVFDMGFKESKSNNNVVRAIAGQLFTGVSQHSNVRVTSGFLTDSLIKGPVVGTDETIEKMPGAFSLSQNYPNPFNPSTTIKYVIAKNSLVTIRIYDVLGNEVETLVNELEEPGSYSRLFIINNSLSSGVYFYQLTAGDFIETRKMILIK